ncbi:hypothetical protein [Shimia sp. SK013]|uniref:hypothetical protein n=1 Tax=Shimia sp. SK013 TaxID=1389006 RepID=UPI0006B5F592|nr:hypothetical protein [Shimia sp. SK013]
MRKKDSTKGWIMIVVLMNTLIFQPKYAFGDNVPDSVSQWKNPNYIACLIAANDAPKAFLSPLQISCIKTFGDICEYRGRDDTLPTQTLECLFFETQRSANFLNAAVHDLPETVELKGLSWRRYEEKRQNLLQEIRDLQDFDPPETFEAAFKQVGDMSLAATTFLYYAREAHTSLEKHLDLIFTEV